ncbi:hypothetical protein DRN69_09390 [Candidatus Pacearchaeota archaeon]|nr:MAG: hypothetical protein DRN69_09390 [Candidatus Pacearchaeota archaeon]
MAKISTTTWKLSPHTKAKHEILKKYLQAWFPIMSRWNGRILYIDGFAGPGVYKNGEPGSPVIAIHTAKEHKLKLNAKIVFWFIEAREDRCKHLKEILREMDLPDNMKYEVECSKFDESLTSLFNYLDEQKKHIAPTFAFIDPFGYSHTPFSIISRIMNNKKCECLINFMSNRVDMTIFNSKIPEEHLDSLFGTEEWHFLKNIKDSKERMEKISRFYQEQLKTVATYVRSFKMINKFNQQTCELFFCTNSIEGLKKMNDSMWNIDKTGNFKFSDRTDPHQTVLFELKPDYKMLKQFIINKFKGKEVSIQELENFVAIKGFKTSHLKIPILKPMEYANPPEIKILSSERCRKGVYPKGTIIKFL